MGKYTLELSSDAKKHLRKIHTSGDVHAIKKVEILFLELSEHPRTGTGKPEQLKGCSVETWSRRINQKHRLCYQIKEETITVFIISALGHYDDK